jgi:hypothetical protein
MISSPLRPLLVTALGVGVMTTGGAASADVRVTPDHHAAAWSREDGGSDPTISGCASGRRPQNEPAVAVDPSDPDTIAVVAQTVCPALVTSVGYFDLGWAGLYRSADGGRTWRASLVPGYPGDTSPAGLGSPLHGRRETAEHAAAFDAEGRLFVAHLGCTVPLQSSCRTFVSVYADHGRRFVSTANVSALAPPPDSAIQRGFGEWTSMAVDRADGPGRGTVYVVFNDFIAYSQAGDLPEATVPASVTMITRSTDHGASWSVPVPVTAPLGVPYTSDVAVGPDGAVHVVVRHVGSTGPLDQPTNAIGGTHTIVHSVSRDGGRTFGLPHLLARMIPFDSDRYVVGAQSENPGVCGDGYFSCANGFTTPETHSNAAVVADARGVHVVYNLRDGDGGRSRILVMNSPDGETWDTPAIPLDRSTRGHQDRVDAVSDGRGITTVFTDSRLDPAFHPDRPVGNDEHGRNAGPSLETFAARSLDGGRTWTERVLSRTPQNPNLGVHESGRVPFLGDYTGVAAAGETVFAVWTDNRDVKRGTDSRRSGTPDGNETDLPCTWEPNDLAPRSYTSPSPADTCFSQGGTDQNIYGARVDDTDRVPLLVRVRPRRFAAGRWATVRVRVLSGSKSRPLAGALVRLGRVSRRTSADGVARLRVRFAAPARRIGRVSVDGIRAHFTVRVLRARR